MMTRYRLYRACGFGRTDAFICACQRYVTNVTLFALFTALTLVALFGMFACGGDITGPTSPTSHIRNAQPIGSDWHRPGERGILCHGRIVYRDRCE